MLTDNEFDEFIKSFDRDDQVELACSPYLLRPLRELEEVLAQREKEDRL